MRKILITGANSYIGISVENWLAQYPNQYSVTTVDMKEENWKNKDFSEFDTIFHVAGLVHAGGGKVSDKKKDFYYKINCDLAIETASKAKKEGVKQFIFMGSMSIYGEGGGLGEKKIITERTIPSPANFYGDSKWKADQTIQKLATTSFKVVILRPPMIYGKGSKGNYPLLEKLVRKFPVFPNVENQRSMLYIENLCEFIRIIIKNEESGIFFPQNSEYVKTSDMARLIAKVNGRKIWITKLFNWTILLSSKIPGKMGLLANKAFGNMVYDKEISKYNENYRICNLEESILQIKGKKDEN